MENYPIYHKNKNNKINGDEFNKTCLEHKAILYSLIGGCRTKQTVEMCSLQNISASLLALPSHVCFLLTGRQMLQHIQASSYSGPLLEREERRSLLNAYPDEQDRPFSKAPAQLSLHSFNQNRVTLNQFLGRPIELDKLGRVP